MQTETQASGKALTVGQALTWQEISTDEICLHGCFTSCCRPSPTWVVPLQCPYGHGARSPVVAVRQGTTSSVGDVITLAQPAPCTAHARHSHGPYSPSHGPSESPEIEDVKLVVGWLVASVVRRFPPKSHSTFFFNLDSLSNDGVQRAVLAQSPCAVATQGGRGIPVLLFQRHRPVPGRIR